MLVWWRYGTCVARPCCEAEADWRSGKLTSGAGLEVSASHFTFVSLLLLISLVAMLARRTRLPYTVALVLAGLATVWRRMGTTIWQT